MTDPIERQQVLEFLVHCMDCPMKLSRRYTVRLKTISKKDARENWDWDGSPYPAINGLNVEER